MTASERVGVVKVRAREIAKNNGLKKDPLASKLNNRDIYTNSKRNEFYAVDTQHGRFEKLDARGKHKGEVDFDFKMQKPADKSGKHDIRVK